MAGQAREERGGEGWFWWCYFNGDEGGLGVEIKEILVVVVERLGGEDDEGNVGGGLRWWKWR